MPKVAILGASGKLGDRLVARALEEGYSVNALARDPRRLTRQNEKLTIMRGDAETGEGFEALVDHCQYVICAIGSLRPVVEACMGHLLPKLEAIKRFQRVVLISRVGTGESRPQALKVSGLLQQQLPVILTPVFRDINLAEARLRSSPLPYTILRSTRLTDDPPTGKVITVGPKDPPPHRITRADLAHHVIELLGTQDHLRAELTVGSG